MLMRTSGSGARTAFAAVENTTVLPTRRKLDSLQALRACAALAVVAHHSLRGVVSSGAVDANSAWFPSATLVQLGAIGVDVFFVLSGFLMTFISAAYFAGQRSPGHFLTQRFIRIWPPYAIVTGVACFLMLAASLSSGAMAFDLQPVRLLSFVFLPSINEAGLLQPIIGPGWTLNYEMMFYVCFAAVIASGPKFAFRKLAAIITSFYLLGLTAPYATLANFLGNAIIFEFLIGAAIGFAFAEGKLPLTRPWAWIFGAVAALAVMTVMGLGERQRLLAYGVPSAMLFLGMLALNNRVRWPKTMVFLGDASYSIYLVHTLVIYRVTSRVEVLDGFGFGSASAIAAAMAATLVAVLVGVLFYILVERPLVARLNGRTVDAARRFPLLPPSAAWFKPVSHP